MNKRFAVPIADGKLCVHFGHCQSFAIFETEGQRIIRQDFVSPPVHEPGAYPKFLSDRGVNVIISGGMGQRALQLFSRNNIEVCMGVNADAPERLVEQYLQGGLRTGSNLCDH